MGTRKIRANYRSVGGQTHTESGAAVLGESTLEHDFVVWCDFYHSIRKIESQPVTIDYQHEGRSRRYTPDFLVEFDDGRTVVYEVKYRDELRDRWDELKPRFRAMHRFCRAQGWRFKIISEDTIRAEAYLKNAYFLRGYRQAVRDESIEQKLIDTLRAVGDSTPRDLVFSTFFSMDWRMRALP